MTARRLRVLQVGKFYAPYKGGMETHLQALCSELRSHLELRVVVANTSRERVDEIEPLAILFLRNAASKWEAPARALSEDALGALRAYAWPGNVRQLRNAIERAVAVCAGEVITVQDLPEHLSDARPGLVCEGLFRWCRNPIFFAVLTIVGGYAILLPTWLSLALWVATFLLVERQVREEEAYLARAYPESFPAYARRIGRFLPGVGCLK